MSARTALNKELIMTRVSGHYQAQTPSDSLTTPTPVTDSDAAVHLHERWEFIIYCSLWLILVHFILVKRCTSIDALRYLYPP